MVEDAIAAGGGRYLGAEFIANSRHQPKGASMASSGIGSVPHLAKELLADATQAKLLHLPYKDAAPAIADVVAGHVDRFFGDIPGLVSFIKGARGRTHQPGAAPHLDERGRRFEAAGFGCRACAFYTRLATLLKNDTAKWSRVIKAKYVKPE